MKFTNSLILASLCATTAFAQRISIGFPSDGATIAAGSKLTVEIDRPNSLSASEEVAIVIGLQSCRSSGPCIAPSDLLGRVLYNGKYTPVFQPGAPGFKPPHQNFTITIPRNTPQGRAQLGVVHVSLIGAGPAPFLETQNISLTIL